MQLVRKCVAGLTVFIKEKQIAQNVPLAAFRAERKSERANKTSNNLCKIINNNSMCARNEN